MAELDIRGRYLYLCDPDKNTKCNHKNCAKNGGNCIATYEKKFELEGMTITDFIVPPIYILQ